MTNRKQIGVIGTAVVAAIALAFGGCQTGSHDERSDGRVMDDKQITETVQKKLKEERVYKLGDIDVSTFGGVVQLSGFVNTEDQKNRAGEIAQQISGVHQVVNGISVKPEPMSPTGATNAAEPRIYSE